MPVLPFNFMLGSPQRWRGIPQLRRGSTLGANISMTLSQQRMQLTQFSHTNPQYLIGDTTVMHEDIGELTLWFT